MPPAAAGGLDIGMLLRAVRRRLPLLLVLLIAGAALGVALQRSVTPRFASSVELLLEPKSANSFGADTQFGSMYVDMAQIASVVSVIESSDLLRRVVASEHLDEVPEFGDPTRSRLRRLLGWLPIFRNATEVDDTEKRQDRALYHLTQAVRVDRVGATYVLTIEATASDPDLARRIAAAVADAYLSDQVERKTAATQRDTVWVTERLDKVRHDLQQSEDALDVVRRQYGLFETALSSGATTDRQALTDLNTQLSQAQAEVTTLRARYEQLEHARSGGGGVEALPELDSSQIVADMHGRLADGAKQLAAMRATYGDNYPAVQRLRDSQSALQAQLGAEVARIVERRRSDYEAAVAREQSVRQQLQLLTASTAGVANAEGHQKLRDAQRLVEANRGLYDSLLTRWREVQQQATREDPEARIISQASLPDKPSFPKPLILPAGGGALFLFVGLVGTLLPPLLERRFVSVTMVEQRLGLPVLGAMPMLRRRDVPGRKRGTAGKVRGLVARKAAIAAYPTRKPFSRFAESLRMTRAYLRISTDGAPSIIHVTSAAAGEGKSTVAATLAVSAAAAGVRTVLVDADVRASTVSGMFGLQDSEGLTDVLELGLPLQSVLRDSGDGPLTVLAGGSARLPRPDVIHSGRFASLLQELAETHSLVVVDGPPVLPVSDALVMSHHVDATILVVEWRATPRDTVQQAVKALRMVGAPLAGVILNKIDLSKISRYERAYPA